MATARHLRNAIALLSLLWLTACGFHLRGAYVMPFRTLYINLPATTELHAVLARAIAASSSVKVVDQPNEAQARLQVLGNQHNKNILSVSAAGQVQEYQLVQTLTFQVIDRKGLVLLPRNQIVIRRDISYNGSQILSEESQESLLWRDMQTDLVQQMLRRLAASKAPAG